MNKTIREQYILFLSILKWGFLAALIGSITGLITTIFLKLLDISTVNIQSYSYYFLLLPIILFISSFIIKFLPNNFEGQGKVIEAVHKKSPKIHISIIPIRLISTIITLAGGGSAGKVGPCAQMGASMASGVGDLFKLNSEDHKKLIICGISAGFSTVFGTPIAGAIFSIEVLVLGRVLNNYLFPVLVASIVGYKVTSFLGIEYHHFNIILNVHENLLLYFKVALSGIIFGLIALLFIEILSLGSKLSKKINIYPPLKGIIGGLSLIVFVYLFNSTSYLGLGTETINSAISGNEIPIYAFLLKILFVTITLSLGGSGGLITPIFFIGATLGAALAQYFYLDVSFIAAIGLVALLSGTTNTPIASIFMSIELFGPDILPYAAIACVISYIIAGHRSIYPSQLIGGLKSNSIELPKNKAFEEL